MDSALIGKEAVLNLFLSNYKKNLKDRYNELNKEDINMDGFPEAEIEKYIE